MTILLGAVGGLLVALVVWLWGWVTIKLMDKQEGEAGAMAVCLCSLGILIGGLAGAIVAMEQAASPQPTTAERAEP